MSQDLFEGYDDSNFDSGMPTEFSGISASGSSASPQSQSQSPLVRRFPVREPPTTPSPPTPTSTPSNKVFPCSVCPKVLQTKSGFTRHMKNHQDRNETPSSSTRLKSQSAPEPSQPTSLPSQKETFTCIECKAVLKTKHGYLKHLAAHKLKGRRPDPASFNLTSTVLEIVEEILHEPNYGQPEGAKIKFLEEFKNNVSSELGSAFVNDIYQVIKDLLYNTHKKILPLNQYEENAKRVNSYLNHNQNKLALQLIQVCSSVIDNSLAGRLVMRMTSKLNSKVHVWYFKSLRSIQEEVHLEVGLLEDDEVLDEIRETNFAEFVGEVLTFFFQKVMEKKSVNISKIADAVSSCMRQMFVDSESPVSEHDFLNERNWFSGEEKSIIPSNSAHQFFKAIEKEIIPQLTSKMDPQEVVQKVLDDLSVLHYWFHLTQLYFPTEESSLLFLRELVSVYVKKVKVLKAQKANRMEEKSVRASTTALRTHLQHNLVEKEQLEEEDEDNM